MNALLDALRRPAGEDEVRNAEWTCIRWDYHPELAVPHLVIGDAKDAGGQWTSCPRCTSEDVQSLSYAGQLSLPGYSFFNYMMDKKGSARVQKGTGDGLSVSHNLAFSRPKRCEVAEYLALYPTAVGIEDSICSGQRVYGVHRQGDSFYITSHNLLCRYLVLATGALTEDKPPPDPLKPLAQWPIPDQMVNPVDAAPILVIGSGFSAADAIISTAPTQKLIHIFRWDPIHNPSPLAAGHSMVYPMSSAIYRLMRAAGSGSKIRIKDTAKDSPMISFLRSRDWAQIYEGIPNATVTNVEIHESRDGSTGGTRCATVTILQEDGSTISREVSCLVYAIGRMGRLDYLDDSLYEEIVDRGCVSPKRSSKPSQAAADSMASALERNKSMKYVTGSTLRRQAMEDLEVAPRVFIIGSLVGDSLVRYADGSCVYTASRIMHDRRA